MAPPSSTEAEETRKFIDKSKPPRKPHSIQFSIEILRFISLCALVVVLLTGKIISETYIFLPDEDTTFRALEQDAGTALRGTEQDSIIDGVGENRNLLSVFGQRMTPYKNPKESIIYETFGFLHACSYIDFNPAKEIASILLPLVFVPLILFIILDFFRMRVSYGNELIPRGLYNYSKLTTPIAILFTSMIHLWFVNDPDKDFPDGYGFLAHYAPYVLFQFTLVIIAIQQVWYHIETNNIPFNRSPRVARAYLKGAIFITVLSQISVISILLGTPLFDSVEGGDEGTWQRVAFQTIAKVYLAVALLVPIICSFWEVFMSKDQSKLTKFTIELTNRKNGNSNGEVTSNRNIIKVLFIAAFSLLALGLLIGAFLLHHGDVVPQNPEDHKEHWPTYLVSRMIPPKNSIKRPTNTKEANAQEWVKSKENCDPFLGEPWLYKGKRSYDTSVTMYFTPSVGNVPGILSGIEVDVYDFVDPSLVGTYFSEQRKSNDGTYHSIAVALQNGAQHNLCDSTTPFAPTGKKYIAIRSGFTYNLVPTDSTMATLRSQWAKGSDMQNMGIHWFQDTKGGPNLSYKAGNLVPISVMYDRIDKGVNAIFFLGTGSKSKNNKDWTTWWDVQGPGLVQSDPDIKAGRYPMCANFCGDCALTGSPDGYYQTMHWWFKDPAEIKWDNELPYTCDES